MDTKDQARHVLLVVDIGGLWGKDLELKMNYWIRVLQDTEKLWHKDFEVPYP